MSITRDIFAELSTEALYDMHSGLFCIAKKIHAQMMDDQGRPVISTLSEQWDDLVERHAAIARTMQIISGIIDEREAENVNA